MDPRRLSIADFLTDASLAALCQLLGQVTRARIALHDEKGRRIVHTSGDPPWHIAEADDASRALQAEIGASAELSAGERARAQFKGGRLVEPIMVAGDAIGALVIDADPLRVSTQDLERLHAIVRMLSSTVEELCEQDVLLHQRNSELSILFRLSSLLVATRDAAAVLQVALRACVELLHIQAGAVHLYDDDRSNLILTAHVGMSDAFAKTAATVPAAGAPGARSDPTSAAPSPGADGGGLGGGQSGPRSSAPDPILAAIAADGFEGVHTLSLAFQGKQLGVVRLCTRRTVYFEPAEQALLQTIIEQVSAAVASAKLIQSESRARQVQRQLKLAADVQRRMLPASPPQLPRLDLAARYIPSLELAGDFYDFIELSGNLGLLIGDVAGKGVPAALLMASVRSSLRAHVAETYHLDQAMARVNAALVRDTLPNEFTTMFYGVIDPQTLRLTYCNAGHDPPLLLRMPRSAGGAGRLDHEPEVFTLDVGGMAIGIDAAQKYQRGMFDLASGDTLVLYTDGIIDARNFQKERFGRVRFRSALVSFLQANPAASAQAIADHAIWEMRRFTGLNPAIDDETIVVLRVRAKG